MKEQNNLVEQIKRTSKRPAEKLDDPRIFKPEDLLSSGSTLLNCACSDTPWGAFKFGKLVTVTGLSQGGKTVEIFTAFAEANKLDNLSHYNFHYDDVESSLEIDVGYLFSPSLKERVKPPPLGTSRTVQNFKANILELTKKGVPFIYGLDSWDALTSDEELEKEMRKALAMAKSEEAVKKIAGSYGAEKAKIASQILRMVTQKLDETKSLLFIVQQLRQNIDRKTPFAPKYITSGGEAPYFYSTHQVWLTRTEHIKDKGLRIGSNVNVKVTKNKLTGKYREIKFDMYYDFGIDDVASCIDFMVDEEYWKKDEHNIDAVELDLKLTRSKLITAIEEQGLERKLQRTVGNAWKEREESVKLNRKKRYE